VVPAETEVIRVLVARFLAGESLRSLATWLDSEGVRTVTGGAWKTVTVKAMLTSGRIAGLREHPARWSARRFGNRSSHLRSGPGCWPGWPPPGCRVAARRGATCCRGCCVAGRTHPEGARSPAITHTSGGRGHVTSGGGPLSSPRAVADSRRLDRPVDPLNEGTFGMRALKQTWWAPLAAVLVVAELLVAQALLIGDGTSNVLNAESTAAGATLSLGGAAALAVGLWTRPKARGVGNALVVVGAVLAAIWFWTVLMTPIAIAVIVGVTVSQVRSAEPTPGTP
jgi:preprotein translocase subunit SecG